MFVQTTQIPAIFRNAFSPKKIRRPFSNAKKAPGGHVIFDKASPVAQSRAAPSQHAMQFRNRPSQRASEKPNVIGVGDFFGKSQNENMSISKVPIKIRVQQMMKKKPLGLLLRFGVKVIKISPKNLDLLRDNVFHSYASSNDLSVENGWKIDAKDSKSNLVSSMFWRYSICVP